jgi:hypothetical protein
MPIVRNYRQLIGKFDKFDSREKNQGIGLPVDAWLPMAFSSVYISDNLYVANESIWQQALSSVLMQASYRKTY